MRDDVSGLASILWAHRGGDGGDDDDDDDDDDDNDDDLYSTIPMVRGLRK